ncbi:MAG TPA: FAD-dependent oxidoreductase, partial [Balneolales bacterium]|nr:FAD-dependent oxidoreductase [Balneolales bacterium]
MKAAISKSISNFKGNVILPGDAGYNEARKIWNAMIDRHPAVIVQCKTADDVQRAIAYAKGNGLEISVRGAGHNIAGSAICDDGVMIDLSLMKKVTIDREKRHAY